MRKKDKAVYLTHLIRERSLYYDYCWLFDKLHVFFLFYKFSKFIKVKYCSPRKNCKISLTMEKCKILDLKMLNIYIKREKGFLQIFISFFLENV